MEKLISIDRIKTGKTGVAFGLIRSRESGRDVHILNAAMTKDSEILFPYLLGCEDRNSCFDVLIGENVGYGIWARFLPCTGNEMELYYTKEARAQSHNMPVSESNYEIMYIDDEYVNEDGYFFIRKIAPDTIEYTVALTEDMESPSFEPLKIYSLKLN